MALVVFKDLPSKDTPLNASNLNHNFDEFKIIAVELIRDEYENLNFGNHRRFTAKSQEQFFEMIDTFRNQIR